MKVNWCLHGSAPSCCSRQTHHWHRNTRAHHSCASESALTPSQVLHNVQTVCTYASGAYRPSSCLPIWHGNGNRWSVPAEEDSDLWTLSDMNFHYWSASSAREASLMPDRKLGMIFLLLSKNLLIRVLSKGNWKLICLHWHILTVVHNFVEAPLVTLGVNGVWNNDNVM